MRRWREVSDFASRNLPCVTGVCIAFNYLGKHKRKMVIRALN